MGLKDILSDDVIKLINIRYSSMLVNQHKSHPSPSSSKPGTQNSISSTQNQTSINSKYLDLLAGFCSMIGLILALIEYEDYSSNIGKAYFTISSKGMILRGIITFFTVLQIALLAKYSMIEFKLWNQKNFYREKVKYTTSPQFKTFVAEAILGIIHPFPGLEANFYIDQINRSYLFNLNGFILCIMLLRTYILIRLATEFSKYTSPLADIVCYRGGTEANMAFALKSMIKERPYLSIMSLMIASVVLFGIAIRIFERPFYYNIASNSSDFQNYDDYVNSMWLVIIAMATSKDLMYN